MKPVQDRLWTAEETRPRSICEETAGWSDGAARAVSSSNAASPGRAGVTRRRVLKHSMHSDMLTKPAASGSIPG